MEFEYTKDDGSVIPVVPKEEYAATKEAYEKAQAEIENLRRVSAEKTENFKRFNEMTEDERKAHSENEIVLLKQLDQHATELGTLKEKLEAKEKTEREYAKVRAISNIAGSKDDVKTALETEYAKLAMPEDTPDAIEARVQAAAKLAGITVNSRNPLYAPVSGEAPKFNPDAQYTDTTEGKAAVDAVLSSLGVKK